MLLCSVAQETVCVLPPLAACSAECSLGQEEALYLGLDLKTPASGLPVSDIRARKKRKCLIHVLL